MADAQQGLVQLRLGGGHVQSAFVELHTLFDQNLLHHTLARAFAAARERGDVVFSCGGIGATPDDHTRQCAAAALDRPLALHPEAYELIMERVRWLAQEKGHTAEPDHPDTLHRLNMGVFAASAQIVPNPYNKIPGFFCRDSPSSERSF